MESRIPNKLFIGGYFSRNITEDTLRDHFSVYGEVEDAVIIRDKYTRLPRGFGFVTFTEATMAANALKDEHRILGRKVDVRYARPKVEKNLENGNADGDNHRRNNNNSSSNSSGSKNKVFVGGLCLDVTSADLKEYFERFGEIAEAFVILNRNLGGMSRCFGFVSFASEEVYQAVLKEERHELKGKLADVKPAVPRVYGPSTEVTSSGLYETYNAYYRPFYQPAWHVPAPFEYPYWQQCYPYGYPLPLNYNVDSLGVEAAPVEMNAQRQHVHEET